METSEVTKIYPKDLIGPRSYFTDLDPLDPDFAREDVLEKLKIQLLTKKTIIIAASSLFHQIGRNFIEQEVGLPDAIEMGIIVPAMRDEYSDVKDFFNKYKKDGYGKNELSFYQKIVKTVVPWNLSDNTRWFETSLFHQLEDHQSILRKLLNISQFQADTFAAQILRAINKGYLERENILNCATKFDSQKQEIIREFIFMLYRLSGSRVVNSDPHMPDKNITKIENVKPLSDYNIFWDIYVEAVMSSITTAAYLRKEDLKRLKIKDILEIRSKLIDHQFIGEYDNILKNIDNITKTTDPSDVIHSQYQINNFTKVLHSKFQDQLYHELKIREHSSAEQGLLELANVLAKIGFNGPLLGAYSTFKAIPKITAVFSPKLANNISRRIELARTYINSLTTWSANEHAALLDGYKDIVSYGLPKSK